mgnify:CR=1 FL=1
MIEALTDVTGESLQGLDASGWLWLDMDGIGLHMAKTLPNAPPSQLSHLWGWGPEFLFRLRADLSLPHGLVGARVARANLGSGAEAIIWPEDIGRVGEQTAQLRRSLRLETYELTVNAPSASRNLSSSITFYAVPDE